jgi:ribosomal protein S24E
MDVISENKNPLMNRDEAWIRIDHGGKPTPHRKDIITEVAKHFKAKEDCVIVDKIFSETGQAASKIKVLVYPKADAVPKDKLNKMKIRMKLMKKEDLKKPAEGATPPAAEGAPQPAADGKPEEKTADDKSSEEKKEEPNADDKPEEEKKDS